MLDRRPPYVQWADVFCEEGPSPRSSHGGCCWPAAMPGWACGCTETSSARGPGCGWRSSSGAASVDHVNYLAGADVEALAGTWAGWDLAAARDSRAPWPPACPPATSPPASRWRPARGLLDAGVEVALASNCNPGTSYTSSMAFCVTTAVLQMGLSVHEAVRAATYGGALALRRDTGERRRRPARGGIPRRRAPGGPARPQRAVRHAPRLPAGDAADVRCVAGRTPRARNTPAEIDV